MNYHHIQRGDNLVAQEAVDQFDGLELARVLNVSIPHEGLQPDEGDDSPRVGAIQRLLTWQHIIGGDVEVLISVGVDTKHAGWSVLVV